LPVLVCVLGPLRLRDGTDEISVRGRQQRRILARLTLGAHQSVTVDALAAAAWGDEPPPTARHSIATHVLRLRRAGVAIATVPDGYRLETPSDASEFERLVRDAAALATTDPTRSDELRREALACWGGHPFDDLSHATDAVIETARLEELAAGVREDLLASELDGDARAELVANARRLVGEEPYRERRWELLMLALYRSGRQAEALDVYAQARRKLIDDLGVEPGTALRLMQQAVLSQDPALEATPERAVTPTASSAAVPGTATRLIGRDEERALLDEVWSRARLVTLLGPPGAGKTRLAVEAARADEGTVWYVALEHIVADRGIAAALLDVIAPSSRATDPHAGLVDALADDSALVVLDGCEQRRADVASELRALLPQCPRVRVLATSRERLGVFDEAVIPVGPLAEDDALELLVDRARLLDPRFEVTEADRTTAVQLCALVDRLPLALELVARHLQLLRVDEVVDRVSSDLGRWAGRPVDGRPGLWAALDTTVERLAPREREVLEALSVMVSDADIELIERVAAPVPIESGRGESDTFEVVSRLVDASLVHVRSAFGPTRYELLRTVAAYGVDAADERGLAATRRRYLDAVVDRAERLAARVTSAARSATLRLLDREMPHVRAALASLSAPDATSGDEVVGLRVAVALSDYWLGRQPAEGVSWLARFLADSQAPPELRAEALLRAAHLAYWLTDFDRGTELAEQARDAFARVGDALGEGRALRRLGAIAAATDDLATARTHLERSLARLDEAGVEAETGTTLLHLGSLLADEGSVDAARPALERALEVARRNGDPLAQGHALAALTLAYWKAGDLTAAVRVGEDALNVFRELGHRPTEGTVAYRLSAITRALGRPRVARHYGLLAIEAGEETSTRTTVAVGHIDLARLDLDVLDHAGAADHLVVALEVIDPPADRWVLVEAIEATARLLAATEHRETGTLLMQADAIRAEIGQPIAPTERDDLDAARKWSADDGGGKGAPRRVLEPEAVRAAALGLLGEVSRAPRRPKRARGTRA
jgi:DNA-binding SARP family transcriptional activator/predicted ATPase